MYFFEIILVFNNTINYYAYYLRILSIVSCLFIIVIVTNWGTKQENYSKILLSYYFTGIYRNIQYYEALNSNLAETLIIGILILALLAYIPLEEWLV